MFGDTETVNKYPMPVYQPRKKVVSERNEEDMYPFTKLGFNLVISHITVKYCALVC